MFEYYYSNSKKIKYLQAKLVNLKFMLTELTKTLERFEKEVYAFKNSQKNYSEQEKLMIQIQDKDIVDLRIELHALKVQIAKVNKKLVASIKKNDQKFEKNF